MAVIDLQVSTSCLRACRAAGSRSVDLKASCVYRLSINADGLMSRHTADEPSQSLCSAIAAHPLGRVQRLSSVDFPSSLPGSKGRISRSRQEWFEGNDPIRRAAVTLQQSETRLNCTGA